MQWQLEADSWRVGVVVTFTLYYVSIGLLEVEPHSADKAGSREYHIREQDLSVMFGPCVTLVYSPRESCRVEWSVE